MNIEDAFVAECRKQGFRPVKSAMTQLAEHYAGSTLDNGSIVLPSNYSIRLKDAVAAMRAEAPDLFIPTADANSAKDELPIGATLTEKMVHEVRKLRLRQMPDDWDAVRSRVTGKTAAMMDEAAAMRMAR